RPLAWSGPHQCRGRWDGDVSARLADLGIVPQGNYLAGGGAIRSVPGGRRPADGRAGDLCARGPVDAARVVADSLQPGNLRIFSPLAASDVFGWAALSDGRSGEPGPGSGRGGTVAMGHGAAVRGRPTLCSGGALLDFGAQSWRSRTTRLKRPPAATPT